MPIGKNNTDLNLTGTTFKDGIPVTEPKDFGTVVTAIPPQETDVTVIPPVENDVTWTTPNPAHFGNNIVPPSYTRSLTVAHGQVIADQNNFTVLVSLTDTTLKTVANGGHVQNASGFDIVFTSDAAGASLLNWEVESYDATNGVLVAWVKLASVSSILPDTVFYMFYGNSAISTFQGGATGTAWDNSFLGIYHLNGAGPSFASSTGSNNGTQSGGVTAATGQIDGGANFASASTQYVDLGNGMNPTAITYSCWMNATSLPTAYGSLVVRNQTNANYAHLLLKSEGKLAVYLKASGQVFYDGTGTYALSTGTWYHVVFTYDSTSGLIAYVNALSDHTVAANGALNTSTVRTRIGQNNDGGTNPWYFNGVIDEVRISNVARSANWIGTEYNNQHAPGTFMTLGAEIQI